MRIKEASQREAKEKEEDLTLLRERLSRCTMVLVLHCIYHAGAQPFCSKYLYDHLTLNVQGVMHVVYQRHEHGNFGAKTGEHFACAAR